MTGEFRKVLSGASEKAKWNLTGNSWVAEETHQSADRNANSKSYADEDTGENEIGLEVILVTI